MERFCIASGARSISDLVRSAMHSLVTGGNQERALASSVNQYSTLVRYLELKVDELAAQVASFKDGVQLRTAGEIDESAGKTEEQPTAYLDAAPSSVSADQLPGETDS